MSKTTILGIDPGFGRVGWGVLQKDRGNIIAQAYGCIETPARSDFSKRLHTIEQELVEIIHEYQPTVVGIESLFFYKNITTAINVSQARGVVVLACHKEQCRIIDITPLQVKQAVTGYGKAEKKQMQKMVMMHLGLQVMPTPDDAADALAVAIATAAVIG